MDLYLQVREREGRLYSDEIVARLPDVPPDHPLGTEWHARKRSATRLVSYLEQLSKPILVMDLGCGNGWLSNLMARAGITVAGVDRNEPELAQASRAFQKNENVVWVHADIFCPPFRIGAFDVIVIASAIQYFVDLRQLIDAAARVLRPQGELHILDSPFYSSEQSSAARERSRQYYERLGVPEMQDHYHHHSLAALEGLNPVSLYTPPPRSNSQDYKDSPFLWIRLRP
jgi:ubiquinone/menaquinone biosynthesis C-methylase UbiE